MKPLNIIFRIQRAAIAAILFFSAMAASTALAVGADPAPQKSIPNWTGDWQIGKTDGGAYAVKSGNVIRIGNRALERVYRIVHDTVATAQWINKISGREPDVMQSNEFGLVLSGAVSGEFTAADFKLTDIAARSSAAAQDIIFTLQCRDHPQLTVRLTVETYPERTYQRKWLNVACTGDQDVIVQEIDVERTGGLGWWNIENPSHVGMGQPLFVADLYMGLEYPGGEVDINAIRHFPGRSAHAPAPAHAPATASGEGETGLKSKSAIWGVAKSPQDLRRAFFDDYLYTLDGVRRADPFVIWNMIGVGTPREDKYMKAVDGIAQHAKEAGIHIDSIAIDDPWADVSSIWQPDPQRFPGGMDDFSNKVQSLGSHLGLWMSVMGLGLDTHWGAAMGMETSQVADRNLGGRYCMAGPKYKAKIIRTLTDYVPNQKVNYFKLDYNVFQCDVPTHGHPIGPKAGREAQIDAFLDILDSVKAADPDCRIALTTGMWLSPWWIQHADYIWLGGNDVESAKLRNLTPQDANTSGRDVMMYDDFVRNQSVFPCRNLMTHGFWENAGASNAKFQDDVLMTLGRGIAKWEILNSPSIMDAKRWEFLGRAMRWARANWPILANTDMILGDPGNAEVYGYAPVGPKAAVIFLRNPDLESKLLNLTMTDLKLAGTDLARAEHLTAQEIYPAQRELDWNKPAESPLPVQILGSETKIIAITADPKLLERLKL
jgi:hypothetical protein